MLIGGEQIYLLLNRLRRANKSAVLEKTAKKISPTAVLKP